jgi:dTMP kinase
VLIVIEGIDGSGKGTHSKRLAEDLKREGTDVALLSFPRYTETRFGRVVGNYLNGKYGDPHPMLAALPYAIDRFESREDLEAAIAVRDVVILDRYVPSNLAHQCARCDKPEAHALYEELIKLEHETFQLPWPDLVIGLDLPVPMAVKLIAKKAGRDYTDKAADKHEADHEYLAGVRRWYSTLASNYSSQWEVVSVDRNGHIRPIDDVYEDVRRAAEPFIKQALRG